MLSLSSQLLNPHSSSATELITSCLKFLCSHLPQVWVSLLAWFGNLTYLIYWTHIPQLWNVHFLSLSGPALCLRLCTHTMFQFLYPHDVSGSAFTLRFKFCIHIMFQFMCPHYTPISIPKLGFTLCTHIIFVSVPALHFGSCTHIKLQYLYPYYSYFCILIMLQYLYQYYGVFVAALTICFSSCTRIMFRLLILHF